MSNPLNLSRYFSKLEAASPDKANAVIEAQTKFAEAGLSGFLLDELIETICNFARPEERKIEASGITALGNAAMVLKGAGFSPDFIKSYVSAFIVGGRVINVGELESETAKIASNADEHKSETGATAAMRISSGWQTTASSARLARAQRVITDLKSGVLDDGNSTPGLPGRG